MEHGSVEVTPWRELACGEVLEPGRVDVNDKAFSFPDSVVLIVFNDPSTYVFNGYPDKSIEILLLISFLINGDKHVNLYMLIVY
jgi:hypothetical protein